MKTKYISERYVELDITRPTGETETLRHPSLTVINDNIFSQIVKGTKDADRGDVIAYRNMQIEENIPSEILDKQRKAKEFDRINNEGYSDGYNPYR